MTPIYKHKPDIPVGVFDLRDKIAIGYQWFKNDSLAVVEKFNTQSILSLTQTKNNSTTLFVADMGGQIARGSINLRDSAPVSTMMMNPNLNREYKSVFFRDAIDKAFLFENGYSNRVILDTKGLVPLKEVTDEGSYLGFDIVVEPQKNIFIGTGLHSYYSRVYGSWRYDTDDTWDKISATHSYKHYANYAIGGVLWNNTDKVMSYMSYNTNKFNVYTYNVATKTESVIFAQNIGRNHTVIPSGFYYKETDDTTKSFYLSRNINKNSIQVYLVKVDVENDKLISNTECSISTSSSSTSSGNFSVFEGVDFNDWHGVVQTFLSKSNNTDYLNIVVFSPSGKSFGNKSYTIWTFKIDSTDSTKLEFVTKYEFNRQAFSMMALNDDKTRIVINTISNVDILTFAGDKWTSTPLAVGTPDASMVDSSGRLWISVNETELYMFIPNAPSVLKITSNVEEVNYSGEPVEAKVYVSAYNYANQRIKTDGTLEVKTGNAKFSDGSVKKSVTTSETEDVEVPILVTGTGIVEIDFYTEV